jgi:hypothetical protein
MIPQRNIQESNPDKFFNNPNFEIIQLYPNEKVNKSKHLEPPIMLKSDDKVKLVTLQEILNMSIPPINWIVPDLLPEGLAIIGGRPKKGKSYFSLNLAISVGSGKRAFNYFAVPKLEVLYISYEDNYQRIQRRARIMLQSEEPPLVYFNEELKFPKLDDIGMKVIEDYLSEGKIKLVIIDTLARAQKYPFSNKNPYFDEYQFTSKLQVLGLKYHACILIVHHTSKPNPKNIDVFDSYNGTTGISAAADTLLILDDKQGKTVLHVTGRDIPSNTYDIEFNEELASWHIKGKTSQIETTAERKQILEVFGEDYSKVLSSSEVAESIGKKLPNTSKMLNSLVDEGILENPKFGKYKLKVSVSKSNVFMEI